MISSNMQKRLNDHLNREFYSSYLYLAMAQYCETINFAGFATWMRVQSHEEQVHATKFIQYMNDQGATVELQAIAAPPVQFRGPLGVFEETLAHEQQITAQINELYGAAVAEKDYATQIFLQWFITEQVEEEKSVRDTVEVLKMSGEHIIVMDHRLGKRGS